MNPHDLEMSVREFPLIRIHDIRDEEESLDSFSRDLLYLLLFACGRHYELESQKEEYCPTLRWCLLSAQLAIKELEKRIKGRPAPATSETPPSGEAVAEAADPASRPTLFDITDQIRCELGKLVDEHGLITDDAVILRVMNLVGGIGC